MPHVVSPNYQCGSVALGPLGHVMLRGRRTLSESSTWSRPKAAFCCQHEVLCCSLVFSFLMFFEVFGGLGLRRLEAAEAAGEALEALEAQVRLQLWGRQLVPRLVRRRSAECWTPSDPSGLRHGRPGAVRTWLAAVCSIIVRALRPAGASGRGNGAATSPAAAARKQSWSRALAASCASSPSAVKKHHVLLVRSGRGASCELRIRWTAAHEAR